MDDAEALRRKEDAAAHLRAFGDRVRELRAQKGVSQEDLAHAAGLHRTVVGFVEQGRREIGLSKVWLLADALGVSAADLFA
ncbi:hypothetical protein GCM10028801_35970 [Nocardioides maradonensis]